MSKRAAGRAWTATSLEEVATHARLVAGVEGRQEVMPALAHGGEEEHKALDNRLGCLHHGVQVLPRRAWHIYTHRALTAR